MKIVKIGDVVSLKSNPETEMTVCGTGNKFLEESRVEVAWIDKDGKPRFIHSIPEACFDRKLSSPVCDQERPG